MAWQARVMRMRAVLMIAVVFLSACSGSKEEPPSEFRRGTAIVETDDGAVLLEVDIADTPELRGKGLMGREELDDDEGMAFLFFEDTFAGFYMKDTLIPLSIAFFRQDGTIVEILDMDPCEEEPCPTYMPRVAYRGAIEVNQGAFERLGIEVGDEVRISP